MAVVAEGMVIHKYASSTYMIHTHFPIGHNTWSIREARLCGFSVAPGEAIRGPNRISENQTLSTAIALFDNPFTRGEHAELNRRSPADRAMFKALLISGMIPSMNAATLQDQTRTNINAADPFNIARTTAVPPAEPTEEEKVEAGRRVRALLTRDQINRLFPGQGALPDRDLGQEVFDRLNNGRDTWNGEGSMQHATNDRLTLFLQLPIEAYRNAKTELDRFLRVNRIVPPGIESADAPAARTPSGFPDTRISRTQYLSLLALMLHSSDLRRQVTGAAVAGNPQATFQALDGLILANGAIVNNVQEAYQVISLDEMGSTEALQGWGVTLGNARTRYIELRRRPRSLPVMQQPNPRFGLPGQPQFIQVMQSGIPEHALTNSVPPATTWRSRPQLALDFLSAEMPQTDDNQRFLGALSHYIGSNWTGGPVNRFTVEDVRSILDITINSLVNSEELENRTVAQTEALRKQVGLSQHVSNFAGEMRDIVMDWRENPIAAAAVGVGAYLAFKGLYHYFFKRNRTNAENFILLPAVFGGLVYGLVQERRTGSAWWDGIGKRIEDWRNGPESTATLTNYWAQELQSNDLLSRKLLSILQDQKVNDVMAFYDLMKSWETGGSRPGEQPPVPATMNFTGFDFGQMGPREKGQAMYALLKRFFVNRGQSVADVGFQPPGHQGGAEAQGAEYIRDRYATPRYFSRIVTGQIRPYGVTVNGSILQEWGQPHVRQRLRELGESRNPNERRTFVYLVSLYDAYHEEAVNPAQGSNYRIWHAMLFEADDGALENMSRNGREAAGIVQRIRRRMEGILQRNTPFAAPPNENAERVVLLDQNANLNDYSSADRFGSGNFARRSRNALNESMTSVYEYGLESWEDFTRRAPLTEAARKALNANTRVFIEQSVKAGTPYADVINELENRKYGVLTLIAVNEPRLNEELVAHLHERDWWTVQLPALVNRALGTRVMPRVTSISEAAGIQLPNSQLDIARKEMNERGSRMRRLRALPVVLSTATESVSSQHVDSLDRHIGLQYATHIMEAYTRIHRVSTDPQPPTPVLQMQISTPELRNLEQFIEQLFDRMVPPTVMARLEEAEKKITAVQNLFNISGATFRVTSVDGSRNMRIVMNTGTVSSTEHFPWTGLTFDEFMTLPEADIVQQWKDAALNELRPSIESVPVAARAEFDNYDGTNWVINAVGGNVEYKPDGLNQATARTPLVTILTHSASEIRSRYALWQRPGGTDIPAATLGDPFNP